MARPVGSTAEIHKTRRDYRFGQETMEHIAGGMAIFAGTLKETAFVERAIAHYAEFLAGDPEALAPLTQELKWLQEHVRQLRHAQQTSQGVAHSTAEKATDQALEIEQLQAQIHTLKQKREQEQRGVQERIQGLEAQVRQSRATVRILENELRQAKAAVPQPAEKKLDLSKAYQIKIRHEPRQACPLLPEGFAYDENELTSAYRDHQWKKHENPVHTVFTQQWPIARVRKELERLKCVPGLTKIWIEKNGVAIAVVSGIPSDSWVKEGGGWIKE